MKKLLLSTIVCVLAMFGTLKAQNSEVIIDGTIGSYTEYMDKRVPISAGDPYSISQQYYTAEEIGVESGYIKSVSFKTDMNWYEDNSRRIEIYMVNTENSAFNSLTMEQVKNEDLVFLGNVKFEANAWTTIVFNKKNFNYTGGNVLLCVNDITTQLCSSDCYFTTFFVPVENGVSRSVCHRNEAMYFDPTASAIQANEQLASVPVVKFAFTDKAEPEQPEEPENPGENEDDVVVIDGTVGSYTEYSDKRVPFSAGDPYSISQQYYTAEEIGKEAGYINSIAFKTDLQWYANDARRLEIYMVNTENAKFNGLTMEQVKNEDLVFSGNVKFESNAWTTIEFNKKNFNYTGGNVLLCVNDITGQLVSLDCYFTTFFIPVEGGVSRSVWHRNEAMYFDPTASAIQANEQLASVPVVKFAFTDEEQPENPEQPETPEQPGEGVEEHEVSFNICPNPVNDRLYIETLTQTQTLTVEIYDVYGRQQSMVNGQQSTVIDVTSLNSGVYFVKVVTENGEMVKRFIKK